MSSKVPGEYQYKGLVGEPKDASSNMDTQVGKARGKHGMNFQHPPQTCEPAEHAPAVSPNGGGGIRHRAVTGSGVGPSGA